MKSLKTYIFESGSSFKSKVNISVKQFNDWKRKNEDKTTLNINLKMIGLFLKVVRMQSLKSLILLLISIIL